MQAANKIIILTAPSGSGKSTIANALMQAVPNLQFSVSAATRAPRHGEIDGQHYYFISLASFLQKIENHEFAEWEKVYEGKYYGTLNAELERIWASGNIPILDIDVVGAPRVINKYPNQVCSIFIDVPIELLKDRLIKRGTETPESLQERLNKAAEESAQKGSFLHVVPNIELSTATQQVITLVLQFLGT
jgi:guanylate kinase